MLGFRVYFTPRQGCFSVFARATRALSVYQEYLALERGRPRFTQDFTSLALLRILLGQLHYAYGAITLCGAPFQVLPLALPDPISPALQPQVASHLVWPLPLSLAATGGISSISFPLATKMFQFTRFASSENLISAILPHLLVMGCPIRKSLGITYFQNPKAYRRISRPSSPLSPKASTIHS